MLTNNFYWSKAYQSLNQSSKNLMWCLYAELRFSGSRKKGTFGYLNNGQISFTETEFRENRLGASQTYLNARNQLIERGFIKITYRGGMARGDMNKYELLWTEDIKHDEMRWKQYPEKNWKHEIPKVKDYIVGRKTRFKKTNNTLNNKILNGAKPPKRLDPKRANLPDG